ncbi:hypothetical protein [Microbacterium imperiale]|uniref:Uncharacterized protein n=1 Tax=Microbacterium imperiale TaxID=33884 RepID=A0A9W6M3E6_9MICO|nr:hypothetical protein [Microbacterium imperiale]MBP2422070.1 hypothetical protein [Microbacterium imperiale]MDS0200227.1 hypothetical protein [Microbacterium imperiale]BFE39379.1 hypothetical protein GCM10017544_03350 [Microbacterium imperiale]GLJ79754.1 hypothetical protein GCM10017586_14360 [Microbacterium imperiale]
MNPLSFLAEHGITETPWARDETQTLRDGLKQWRYRTPFLATTAVRDLAWFAVEGWQVFLQVRGDRVLVIITEPMNSEGR